MLKCSCRSAIWQAFWQQCCRSTCQISEILEHFNTHLAPSILKEISQWHVICDIESVLGTFRQLGSTCLLSAQWIITLIRKNYKAVRSSEHKEINVICQCVARCRHQEIETINLLLIEQHAQENVCSEMSGSMSLLAVEHDRILFAGV